jgi:hypothetical protein
MKKNNAFSDEVSIGYHKSQHHTSKTMNWQRIVKIVSRFSGMLRCVTLWLSTDVSGRHTGPIFKGQEVRDYLIQDGTDILSRNVGNHLPTYIVQYPRRAKSSTTLITGFQPN